MFPQNKYLKNILPLKPHFLANGSFSQLELENLKVSNPFLKFFGNLNVKNLLNEADLKIKILTDSLKIKIDEFRKINSIPHQVNQNLAKISNLNLKGISTFNLNNLDFDLFSKNKWGNFSTKGKLGIGVLNKTNPNKGFEL